MRLGIDTGYFEGLSLAEALEHAAGLGWRDVQLSTGHVDPDGGLQAIGAARAVCDRLGVRVRQVHSNAELGSDAADVSANVRWVDCAKALGARCVITHANGNADYHDESGRQDCLELNLVCLTEVASYAAPLGVQVALENRLERPWATCRRFGARAKDFLDLIAAAGCINVGICLDTSHTRVSRLSFADEIAACGPKLLATQISDSDGDQQHRMPFSLDINFSEVVSSLKQIDYDGLLTLDCRVRGASVESLDEQLLAVRERLVSLLEE